MLTALHLWVNENLCYNLCLYNEISIVDINWYGPPPSKIEKNSEKSFKFEGFFDCGRIFKMWKKSVL
jgi:hypothetical protein